MVGVLECHPGSGSLLVLFPRTSLKGAVNERCWLMLAYRDYWNNSYWESHHQLSSRLIINHQTTNRKTRILNRTYWTSSSGNIGCLPKWTTFPGCNSGTTGQETQLYDRCQGKSSTFCWTKPRFHAYAHKIQVGKMVFFRNFHFWKKRLVVATLKCFFYIENPDFLGKRIQFRSLFFSNGWLIQPPTTNIWVFPRIGVPPNHPF